MKLRVIREKQLFNFHFKNPNLVNNKDESLLLPFSNLFQTSIKFENLIEFEFSREKL